jgi:hypothetical protein
MKRFPFKLLPKYPHLLSADIEVWEEFILQYPNYFDHVDYDVHVGKGIEHDPEWDASTKKMATSLSQHRIDALGWNGDQPTIIEVKPNCNTQAIGQIAVYLNLFISTYPELPKPKKLIICTRFNDDVLPAAMDFDIKVLKV